MREQTTPQAPVNVYRRVQTDPADWFSPEETAKAKAYQRPLTRARLAGTAVNFAALLVLISLHAAPGIADAAGAEAWWARVLVVVGVVVVLFSVIELPFSWWQSFRHDRRWEFSTETPRTFVLDAAKGLVVSFVLFSALLLPVWGIIRLTDAWWVFGWLAFFAVTVALAVLYPIVIMPIFNRFDPLDNTDLADRLRELARSVGLRISDVLVMDASKRTRKDNAVMTGLGKTRRVIVFDNMLAYPERMIELVVSHELGHWRRRHIPKSVAVGAVTSFLLFLALWAVTSWEPALTWAGVDEVADPGAIPLFLLVFTAGSSLLTLGRNWLSRAWERQADVDALEMVGDPDAFIEMMRRFATKNLMDVAPSTWQYHTKYSHPPIPERMALAAAWKERRSPRPPSEND